MGGRSPPWPAPGTGLRADGGVMRAEGECGGAVGRGGGVRGMEDPEEVRPWRGLLGDIAACILLLESLGSNE